MASGNDSLVTEFILLGLTQEPELQLPLLLFFLGNFVATVVSNTSLLVLIGVTPHLHTPMYYFLFNLSFIDLCYASVIMPKMLMSFVTKNNISYSECMAQLYFFSFFVIDECYVLTSMSYDRYVAICKPLIYKVVMSPKVCLILMMGTYTIGFVGAMAHTGCMLRLTFCNGNVINHFMCDIPPLLHLSCTNTNINELVAFIVMGISIIVPSITIFISYSLILYNVLHMRSTEGRSKAFSTCSSHIIAVCLFFGSSAFMYLKPFPVRSLDQEKILTIFYTVVAPVMNPFIYSLRNKDVHVALSKILKRKLFY